MSTIKTRKNSTEVGVRKVFGANPVQLIKVYLTSSCIIIGLSIVFGILLSWIFLPVFEHFVNRTLIAQFQNPMVWLAVLHLGILLIGVTGIVPGLAFSKLKPITVFKTNSLLKYQNPFIRDAFIVFQFVVTISLLTSQFIIYKQIRGMEQADLGFDFENVTAIDLGYLDSEDESPYSKIKTFKAEIERYGAAFGLGKGSVTENVPGYYFQNGFTVLPQDADLEECLVTSTAVDKNYLDLFDIKLMQGRFFSDEHKNDKSSFIINETAMKRFGWQDIEGKYIRLSHEGEYYPVIGVLKDIVKTSLREKTNPMIFRYGEHNNFPAFLSFRINPDRYTETIAYMESTWKEMFPDVPFQTLNVKEVYYANYQEERELIQVIGVMSAMAIVLTVLGLMGVVTFITEMRTKEIGVRKVNGAKVLDILNLLNKRILTWILIASILASPVAYFAMNKWLESFVYKTDLSWWVFVLAGSMTIMIALVTVSWQSWRAANKNPVEALRYE